MRVTVRHYWVLCFLLLVLLFAPAAFATGTTTVTSVSPNTGSTAGGEVVTITGTYFIGTEWVKFGTNLATNISGSSNQLTVTSPAVASAGTVDVTVTTPSGTSAIVPADQFTYSNPPPTVTSVSPNTGSTAGGDTVTITGSNFIGTSSVAFGTNLATIDSVSGTQITVTSPASAGAGTVDVTVTTPSGTSATGSADQFTYSGVILAPVASFSANSTTGTAPLAVQFTDTSTNLPTAWNWSFTNVTGNNTEIWWSTSESPELTFGAGNYSIALNASNSAGYSLSTPTTFINVSAGTVVPYIDLSVAGSLTNWNLEPGINQDDSSVSLTITTNINNWEVSAVDGLDGLKPAHTAGYMMEYDGSSYVSSGSNLTNPLNIAFGGGPPIALSSTPQTIASGTSSGTTSGNLGISQLIATTDTILTNGHQYRIVITLAGSQP